MSDDLATEPQRSTTRRLAGALVRIVAIGSAILIAAGLAGQAIRDRSVATALMMYIPLILLGLAALVLDLLCRGRSLPRARFGLTILGVVAIGWSTIAMTGTGVASDSRAGDEELTLLHWNVQWGGGLFRGPRAWKALRSTILDQLPDLVVLSEAPPDDWLGQLNGDLGAGASHVGIFHDPSSPYWYRMVVCSRWPIHLEGRLPLPGGVAMSVTAEVRGRVYRLLVVDGVSSPLRSRLPFLRAIAGACRDAESAGRPYDFVVGDFNTPSRSLGFDALADQGYRLASRSAFGWRATFPAWLPVYDIDHVWIGPRLRARSCSLFNSPWTDHRGQIVRVLGGRT
jgi:endonuclease/exonuclease/phosphatase family metal-dependent hydrolase